MQPKEEHKDTEIKCQKPQSGKTRKDRKYPKKKGFIAKEKQSDQYSGNDFSFWNDYPELMQAAAKVAYQRIPGLPENLARCTAGTTAINYEPANILVVKYQAALGSSTTGTSAINLAMRNLWLDMHRKYRGLGGYEYSDLAIVECAIIDVWGWIAEFERVYGLLNNYPVNNRTAPTKVLSALGMATGAITFLSEHLAEFRYRLNRLIIKAKRLCLPKGFKYLENRIAMNAFMYADSKDVRASYIIFKQTRHWKYAINTITGGYLGVINNTLYTSNATPTMDTFFLDIEDCIDVLVNDTDVARICSDLLAAVGPEQVEALAVMPEDYAVHAEYNENILLKLHNAEMYGGISSLADLRTGFKLASELPLFNGSGVLKPIAYQGNGQVISIPIIVTSAVTETAATVTGFGVVPSNSYSLLSYGEWQQHYIDDWKDNPGVEDVCEACLWKTTRFANANYYAGFTSCSTEVITDIDVVNYLNGQVMSGLTSLWDNANVVSDIAALTQIDWHPIIALVDDQGTSLEFKGIFGDTDNLTWHLDGSTIRQIHDAALLSAFNVTLAVKE